MTDLHGSGPDQPATWREQLQAVALAAACAVLFLGDALLPGRALVPFPPEMQAVQQAEAMATGRFDDAEAYRGKYCMGDKYAQTLAWDRIMQDRFRAGEIPLWTRDIAGGASFVPQMAQVYQPWNLLLLLVPSAEIYGIWWLLHLMLFGWLGYRFFRRIGCRHQSSLLAVVVLTLGMWTQCKLHHNVILTAALSLFPMLSSIHAISRGENTRRSIGWLALWTGLTWMSGFVVVSVLQTYLAVAWAGMLWLKSPDRRLRPLLLVGLGMALGAVLSLAHMAPVLLAAMESARGSSDPASLLSRALEWDYLLTLLYPDLFHWASDAYYPDAPQHIRPTLSTLVFISRPLDGTGYNWVENSFAVGLPAILVAAMAFADRARRPIVWFFGLTALFAFALSTATTPVFQIGRLLPGFGSSDLKRVLYLVAMCLAVLVAVGGDQLMARRRLRLATVAAATIALFSALVCWFLYQLDGDGWLNLLAALISFDSGNPYVQLAGGDPESIAVALRAKMVGGWEQQPLADLQHVRLTLLRASVVAGGTAVALRLLSGSLRMWVLIALTALELWHAGRGPVVTVPAEQITTPPAVVAPVVEATALANQTDGVRPRLQRLGAPDQPLVFSIYPPNLAAFHGLEDACCYNPLPPERMEQFFLAIEPDEKKQEGKPGKQSVVWGGAGVGWFRLDQSVQHPLLDLFGIRYLLASRHLDLPGVVDRTPPGAAAPFRLYERTTCLPRATFVQQLRIIPDASERLAELARADRDPATELILEDPSAPATTPDAGEAQVEILEHRDQLVRIRVHNSSPGYLRLADPYDPGWIATDNGNPTPIYVADHYLRAIHLSPGTHEVLFTFTAPRVLWPPYISLLALLAILTLLLAPKVNFWPVPKHSLSPQPEP